MNTEQPLSYILRCGRGAFQQNFSPKQLILPKNPFTSFTYRRLFEPIPPVLVQMTVVHEPCLKLSQLCPHLEPLLCKTLGRCPLLLGVLAMGRTSRCKARQAVLRLGSCGSAAVQGTAPIALVSRPLAGRALTGLGPAPLARPIGAKAETVSLLEPTFCHLKTYRCYGVLLCHICSRIARYRLLGSWVMAQAKPANANSLRVTLYH